MGPEWKGEERNGEEGMGRDGRGQPSLPVAGRFRNRPATLRRPGPPGSGTMRLITSDFEHWNTVIRGEDER